MVASGPSVVPAKVSSFAQLDQCQSAEPGSSEVGTGDQIWPFESVKGFVPKILRMGATARACADADLAAVSDAGGESQTYSNADGFLHAHS